MNQNAHVLFILLFVDTKTFSLGCLYSKNIFQVSPCFHTRRTADPYDCEAVLLLNYREGCNLGGLLLELLAACVSVLCFRFLRQKRCFEK